MDEPEMEMEMAWHRQVDLLAEDGTLLATVDEGIAPLVRECLVRGWQTVASCEDNRSCRAGRYVAFAREGDARAFHATAGSREDRRRWARVASKRRVKTGPYSVLIQLDQDGHGRLADDSDPSRGMVWVVNFPTHETGTMAARLASPHTDIRRR